ncbi:hypothetical protein G9P44_005467 [Scheffersomyces stipitis]|nr:hypothetical protein G9P44_005467 [Scheffersomyces stipitis]
MFRATASSASLLTRNVGRRFISRSSPRLLKAPIKSNKLVYGLGGLTMAGVFAYFNQQTQKIELDTSIEPKEDTITVDSSISPFPLTIQEAKQANVHDDFQLLGHGVRSVTFVSFKVYGIGIYIAKKDVKKAHDLLLGDLSSSPDGKLEDLLNDAEKSVEIVEKLLDSGVRFLVRLSPVRNTDFNHMKDGLIKSILANPKSKENRELVGEGLDQLRTAFSGRKGSVPKDHLLYFEILPGGKLSVSYENPVKKSIAEMGVVQEPLVSKILFLSYLSGRKPLSESLRKSSVEGLASL